MLCRRNRNSEARTQRKMEEKLRESACHGDIDAIHGLIRNGVDINDKHKINGWTALHWAARRNQQQVIKVS